MSPQTALRRPGRPLGSTKRLTPKIPVRVNLEPKTVALMERHIKASGLEIGPWLDFTIADLESGGRLLKERRERDLSIRQAHHFVNATIALLRCQSVEQFLELAKSVTRPHQKK